MPSCDQIVRLQLEGLEIGLRRADFDAAFKPIFIDSTTWKVQPKHE